MLDQLVESKDQENGKKIGILGVILIVMMVAVGAGIMWDLTKLFAEYMKSGMGGDLELTALVAPVPVQQEEPKPEPEKEKTEQAVDLRKEIIQNIMESPQDIPDKISNEKPKIPPRRLNMPTAIGEGNANNPASVMNPTGPTVADGTALGGGANPTDPQPTGDEPALATPKPTPKPVPKTVSGGVVNSKATSLVKPAYPAAARAVRASGAVNVQVTISETGSVISASAVSGHPLLRGAAEAAARSSRFSPTLLSGQPVKVTGVIVYNFVAP